MLKSAAKNASRRTNNSNNSEGVRGGGGRGGGGRGGGGRGVPSGLDGSPTTCARSKEQLKDPPESLLAAKESNRETSKRSEENLDTQEAPIAEDVADTSKHYEENQDPQELSILSKDESFLQGGLDYLTAAYMIEYLEAHPDLRAVQDAVMGTEVDAEMLESNFVVKGLSSVLIILHQLAFQGHKKMKDCRKTMTSSVNERRHLFRFGY
jgi:hypothetical protein